LLYLTIKNFKNQAVDMGFTKWPKFIDRLFNALATQKSCRVATKVIELSMVFQESY
jgi:hypothetical protein